MLFLNKMDRVGASFRSSMQSILNFKLHPNPMPITLPVASFDVNAYSTAEPGIEGIVDLVRWEVWKWDASKRDSNGDMSVSVLPLPDTVEGLEQSNIFPSNHPLVKELVPARTAFLENLSMFSEELMDEVLYERKHRRKRRGYFCDIRRPNVSKEELTWLQRRSNLVPDLPDGFFKAQ